MTPYTRIIVALVEMNANCWRLLVSNCPILALPAVLPVLRPSSCGAMPTNLEARKREREQGREGGRGTSKFLSADNGTKMNNAIVSPFLSFAGFFFPFHHPFLDKELILIVGKLSVYLTMWFRLGTVLGCRFCDSTERKTRGQWPFRLASGWTMKSLWKLMFMEN